MNCKYLNKKTNDYNNTNQIYHYEKRRICPKNIHLISEPLNHHCLISNTNFKKTISK